MVVMASDEEKERHRARRRNHIVKDLTQPKYHQRVVPGKRHKYKEPYLEGDFDED
jgi:hypothetical protein